jgi:hypothetical protein
MLDQPHGEGSRADERQIQSALPAQAAYLDEHRLPGKIPAGQYQVIESAIRLASHDFKDSVCNGQGNSHTVPSGGERAWDAMLGNILTPQTDTRLVKIAQIWIISPWARLRLR